MKVIGTGTFDANVTTTTRSLANAMMLKPEISANVANLFEDNFSAFSSYLSRRGMTKKGILDGMQDPNFKVVGSNKIMWAIKGYPFRKGTITQAASTGNGQASLGINGSVFTIYLDTNYFSPNDVLELADRRTNVQVMGDFPTEVAGAPGTWAYQVKLITNVAGAFVAASLVTTGMEVGFLHTAFHELSETGYEKNTYPEWRTNYMTIQRMQYSISGSASESVTWIEHNGQRLWVKTQEMEMMRRWAYARENQLLWGKSTVDANGNVYLKDLHGREILQGDGIIAQGEGSLKYQYNKLNFRVIENVMRNMQLLSNGDGVNELLVIAGQAFIWDFSKLMTDVFKYNPMPLFMDANSKERGVNATFNAYEIGGVRIITAWDRGFDAPWRPQATDIYGVSKESRRAIFVSLGNTIGGDASVELCALGNRDYISKTIDGMASPGGTKKEFASNSMDGYQRQVISETAAILRNPFGVAELYVP